MEEKIYERQVTKETLSHRVVDEHQIDRHFNAADLQELYTFKPDRLDDISSGSASQRPLPVVPKVKCTTELLFVVVINWYILGPCPSRAAVYCYHYLVYL